MKRRTPQRGGGTRLLTGGGGVVATKYDGGVRKLSMTGGVKLSITMYSNYVMLRTQIPYAKCTRAKYTTDVKLSILRTQTTDTTTLTKAREVFFFNSSVNVHFRLGIFCRTQSADTTCAIRLSLSILLVLKLSILRTQTKYTAYSN